MGIRLSAVGMSEVRPMSENASQPFDLHGDDDVPGEDQSQASPHPSPVGLPPTNDQLLMIFHTWVTQQRKAYQDLEAALGALTISPTGKACVQINELVQHSYPADLLSKPWDNLMVSDARLGFPAGCIKVLNEAGVISLEALSSCIAAQGLTRLPKVGKAKAAVILETYRAFERAVEAARKDAES